MSTCTSVPIESSVDERARSNSWAGRHTSAQALALRSRVVLLAAEGLNSNVEAVQGPALRGQRPRRGRSVSQPPGQAVVLCVDEQVRHEAQSDRAG